MEPVVYLYVLFLVIQYNYMVDAVKYIDIDCVVHLAV